MLDKHAEAGLQERIRAEYREMPGMRLTLPQAARLFNLEATDCARVLEALVSIGALRTNGHEFMASDVGHSAHTRTRRRMLQHCLCPAIRH
jgi:hypothetical protein